MSIANNKPGANTMGKTAIELAFREVMVQERAKKETKWPERDVRRTITVALWNAKEERKARFILKFCPGGINNV